MLNNSVLHDRNREQELNKQAETLIGPITISLDVTNKCNLRCRHCYNNSGDRFIRQELTDKQMVSIVEEVAEFKPMSFCICGGEPLLRTKLVFQIIKILKSNGSTTVNMVSNGILLTEDIGKELNDSGLDGFQISLDGHTKELHEIIRGIGSYERAIRGIEILISTGLNWSVASIPTKHSIDHFPTLVTFVQSLGCQSIRTQPLMIQGEGLINAFELVPSHKQYTKLIDYIHDKQLSESGITIEWGDPIDHLIKFSQINTKPNLVGDIKANGDLSVSTYLPLVVGNLTKHSFSEYWENGYNKIWEHKLVQKLAYLINSIPSMGDIKPCPFFEDPIKIDLVNTPEDKIEKYIDIVDLINNKRNQN